jgi:hypothetical protein
MFYCFFTSLVDQESSTSHCIAECLDLTGDEKSRCNYDEKYGHGDYYIFIPVLFFYTISVEASAALKSNERERIVFFSAALNCALRKYLRGRKCLM